MKNRSLLASIPLAFASACNLGDSPAEGGPVTIAITQALTSQTASSGTFTMTGAYADGGQTTEEVTFGGPLTQSPVPITFRRTMSGRHGTLVVKGSATLTFTSPSAAGLAGSWEVESATGRYRTGRGTLSGDADFGATPPSASIRYAGSLDR
ncbi:MAG: hypothetical protein H7066_21310 [Cytophagaceae bacterium]|nr:hypothetical protein [Gemmatimonadaceae bacterium]